MMYRTRVLPVDEWHRLAGTEAEAVVPYVLSQLREAERAVVMLQKRVADLLITYRADPAARYHLDEATKTLRRVSVGE